jgi:hypothetical protein
MHSITVLAWRPEWPTFNQGNHMYNFSFQGWAVSNAVDFPKFLQTMQLQPSVWMCIGGFRKPYTEQAIGGERDVKDLTEQRSRMLSNH